MHDKIKRTCREIAKFLCKLMKEKEMDSLLEEMINRLVKTLNPKIVSLFGSRTDGVAIENSDYDIFIVMDKLDKPSYFYSQDAHVVLWGIPCSKDIFYTTSKNFQELKTVTGTLSELVLRAGKQIYAKAA